MTKGDNKKSKTRKMRRVIKNATGMPSKISGSKLSRMGWGSGIARKDVTEKPALTEKEFADFIHLAPKKEITKRVKFKDLPLFEWFSNGTTRFIKLQNNTNGNKTTYYFEHEGDKRGKIEFNAVDDSGQPARCPDEHEFIPLGVLLLPKFSEEI